jgi:ubiquinone/menaquinone biosynthesis C-methylase UbiE
LCFDAQQLPFPEKSFDVVICFEVIEHLDNPRLFLSESKRVLRSNGIFLCSTPNAERLKMLHVDSLSAYHKREYSVDEFSQLLSKSFQEFTLWGLEPLIGVHAKSFQAKHKILPVLGSKVRCLPQGDKIANCISRLSLGKKKFVVINTLDVKNYLD